MDNGLTATQRRSSPQHRHRSGPRHWSSDGRDTSHECGGRRLHWPPSQARANSRGPSAAQRSVWATKVAGRIVGWVALTRTGPDELTIMRLSVSPEFQHTHVVSDLLCHIQGACAMHPGSTVIASPGAMPGWLHRSLQRHGLIIEDRQLPAIDRLRKT